MTADCPPAVQLPPGVQGISVAGPDGTAIAVGSGPLLRIDARGGETYRLTVTG